MHVFCLIFFAQIIFGLPLSNIFTAQNKICTTKYVDGQVSFRSTVRQIFGIPSSNKLSNRLSKWIEPKDYTGVKILKVQTLKNGISGLFSSVSINYCHEGQLMWSKEIPRVYENQICLEWNLPVCFFDHSKLNQSDIPIIGLTQQTDFGAATKLEKFKVWVLETMKIKDKADVIKYSPLKLALDNPEYFYCYKLARRKKYAKQKLNIFLPKQFIGGLFKCDISIEAKQYLLMNHMDENLNWIHNNYTKQYLFNFCNEKNSKPIFPLLADNFENYWSDYNGINKHKDTVFINISKKVPFLYTPHIIDSTSSADDIVFEWTHTWKYNLLNKFKKMPNNRKNWYNEINVNENYNYSTEEMNKVEKYTQNALAKIQNFSLSNSSSFFDLRNDVIANSQGSYSNLFQFSKKILMNTLALEDKVTTVLTNKLFRGQLREIIKETEIANFKQESFHYEEI